MKNKFKKTTYLLILFVLTGILLVYAAQYYNIGNNTQQTVNEWGTGGVVYNSCGPGIFVPTNTSGEINTFISKKPTCAKLCPFSTSYNSSSTKCEATPSCSSGTYSGSINLCADGSNYTATLVNATTFNIPIYRSDYYYDTLARYPQYGLGFYGYAANVAGSIGLSPLYWSAGYEYNWYINSQGMPIASYYDASCIYGDIPMYNAPWYPTWNSPTDYGYGIVGCLSSIIKTVGGTYTCPSGGTLSGTTCINSTTSSAICPSGTTLNGATDKCESVPR